MSQNRSDDPTVIIAGARTPMGRLLGSLKDLPATALGGIAIAGALERSGLHPPQIDHVIMGHVLQAGCGQITARQAAVAAGLPMTVPALTVNKVCLSGLAAIAQADQMIRAGEATTVVAGGMESMSRAPHLLDKSREGQRYGNRILRDSMEYDGLWDVFTDQGMGDLTESANHGDVTREEQDAFAARSHRLAAQARTDGLFAEEIVPVSIPRPDGEISTVDQDEGIRPSTTVEGLSRLRPAFRPTGTVTAGSASQISDGACAVVVTRRSLAQERGLSWLAEIGAYGTVAGPDSTLQSQPARAIAAACRKEGLDPQELDVVEINEAFAAVGIAAQRLLGLDPEKVNPHGGAIALGHPLGMSGARIVLTLALELRRRGGGVGAAGLCGGGGQGDALLLRVPRQSAVPAS
ncbi:acetyl-CoA C-acetyltransferase [Austwickia chelonae]|uniref:Probable acetyl-CoA acetyltransferase n=1 Tax=Austwickia chelonae NBRC 105200 TaxID=1184607 RepID=K6UKT5_9MICO|nr:acetyl-CoA C-acetyltransferase [Austwickia chelonae]GAB76676.1 putative acetyl-CoA acetyltransferase [Austwickia chelonae NBRC 105200]SEW29129.1 acetyl-CoA C-acetyltransferase [Austwickia chelonae]